jgi:hypothetical protein
MMAVRHRSRIGGKGHHSCCHPPRHRCTTVHLFLMGCPLPSTLQSIRQSTHTCTHTRGLPSCHTTPHLALPSLTSACHPHEPASHQPTSQAVSHAKSECAQHACLDNLSPAQHTCHQLATPLVLRTVVRCVVPNTPCAVCMNEWGQGGFRTAGGCCWHRDTHHLGRGAHLCGQHRLLQANCVPQRSRCAPHPSSVTPASTAAGLLLGMC